MEKTEQRPLGPQFLFAMVKGGVEDNVLEAVASTAALDRQSEIIEPEAWKASLATYLTNPVILATHQHRLDSGDSPVIGSASSVDVKDGQLVFRMRFAGTALGQQYAQLYREGHMRAFSVGFLPVNGQWRDAKTAGAKRVWVHTVVELLEISAVPVPANPEALARMRAAMAGGLTTPEFDLILAAAVGNLRDAMTTMQSVLLDRLAELEESITLSADTLDLAAPRRDAPGGDGDQADAAGGDGAMAEARAAASRLAKSLSE